MEDYSNTYAEVLEILDNLVEEDYKKIPKEYINYMKECSNKDYDFKYDKTKPFKEQDISTNAKLVLFFFFEEFATNEVQKEKIKRYKMKIISDYEREKVQKYSTEDLFKNRANNKQEEATNDTEKEKSLIAKKDNILHKITCFIKNIFTKKNK